MKTYKAKILKKIFKLFVLISIQMFLGLDMAWPGEFSSLSPKIQLSQEYFKQAIELISKVELKSLGSFSLVTKKKNYPSEQINRKKLIALTKTHDGILEWLEDITKILGKKKLLVFDFHVDCDYEGSLDSSWLWELRRRNMDVSDIYVVRPSWDFIGISSEMYELAKRLNIHIINDVRNLPISHKSVIVSFEADYINDHTRAGKVNEEIIEKEILQITKVLQRKKIQVAALHLTPDLTSSSKMDKLIIEKAKNEFLTLGPNLGQKNNQQFKIKSKDKFYPNFNKLPLTTKDGTVQALFFKRNNIFIVRRLLIEHLTGRVEEKLNLMEIDENFETEMLQGYCRFGIDKKAGIATMGINIDKSDRVIIFPKHTKKGLGSAMVSLAVEEAKKEGLSQFIVFNPEPGAISLYKKLGFRWASDRKNMILAPQKALKPKADGSNSWKIEDVAKYRNFKIFDLRNAFVLKPPVEMKSFTQIIEPIEQAI